ncbi:MAG TPA: hypothetical protein DDZ90_16010 [Planctomycetaceae bacterium]|nr:hypothetical protein [Planctomycetaceae bacterium]
MYSLHECIACFAALRFSSLTEFVSYKKMRSDRLMGKFQSSTETKVGYEQCATVSDPAYSADTG